MLDRRSNAGVTADTAGDENSLLRERDKFAMLVTLIWGIHDRARSESWYYEEVMAQVGLMHSERTIKGFRILLAVTLLDSGTVKVTMRHSVLALSVFDTREVELMPGEIDQPDSQEVFKCPDWGKCSCGAETTKACALVNMGE